MCVCVFVHAVLELADCRQLWHIGRTSVKWDHRAAGESRYEDVI